jgi:hypothetical protein
MGAFFSGSSSHKMLLSYVRLLWKKFLSYLFILRQYQMSYNGQKRSPEVIIGICLREDLSAAPADSAGDSHISRKKFLGKGKQKWEPANKNLFTELHKMEQEGEKDRQFHLASTHRYP